MKFVFVATDEYKAAPGSLKLSYWMLVLLAIAVAIEVFTSGALIGLAPGLSFGTGVLGVLLAYVVFDTANTLVRKRKTAKLLAMVFALASIALAGLEALQSEVYALAALGLPGLVLLVTLNSAKSKEFFAPRK